MHIEQRSPSGDWIALVTVSDCGAVANYGTAVILRRAKGLASSGDQIVLTAEGDHAVGLSWRDDQTLVVELPSSTIPRDFADAKITTRKDVVDGVQIVYEQFR